MINNIRIASPCSADWEQMPGDDRVRHCHACNLNVYNLSAFTEREIRALVANREGRLCARLYRRSDGTVLTQNCPVGLRALSRRLSRIAGAVLSFMMPNVMTLEAAAQSYALTNVSDAALQVEVLDPTGKHVRNAAVTLTERSRHLRFQGKTDKDGRLVLRSPVAGRYVVTVSSIVFDPYQRTVELRAGQVLSLPVRLTPAPVLGNLVIPEYIPRPDSTVLPSLPGPLPAPSAPKPMQR
jgi:hypothetical protein